MTELSISALNIAISQLDEREDPIGSNWGHPVKDYLASVGIDFPASWCMAFLYWCVEKAANELQVPNPMIKTGGVLREWNEIDKQYKFATPHIGSIFILDFGHGLGHTGIVERIDANFLHTVEGNTNDTGSREGYEVCRKIRNSLKCKGFINL